MTAALLLLPLSCAGFSEEPGGQAMSVEGPEPNVDNPVVNGIRVLDSEMAAEQLAFLPRVPESLADPASMIITDPLSASPPHRVFGLVYQHPTYGRFWVIQRIAEMSQADLESWADCDPAAGCEGTWELVDIGHRRGILIQGSATTSVVWLMGEVRIDVVGPPDTFTSDHALEVAREFAKE